MSTRRQRASAHARRAHTCPRCSRVIFGNGYGHHAKACHVHILFSSVTTWCSTPVTSKVQTTETVPNATKKDICGTCRARKADRMAPSVGGGALPMRHGEVAPTEIAGMVKVEMKRTIRAMEEIGVPLERLLGEKGGTA